MSELLDGLAIALGFYNYREMAKMISEVDISTPENKAAFEAWKLNDASKEGILKLKVKESING